MFIDYQLYIYISTMIFTYQRTIRFADTDAAGVVYFANILNICHEAYEDSLIHVNINMRNFFTHPSIAYVIVHASADYLRPIYCGDKLIINLIPKKITEDKFDINYEISVNNVIVAKAITRHVCIDVATRNKRQMSGEIISWLETNRRDVEDIERKKSREEII